MDKNTALSTIPQHETEDIISPEDSKHWEIVSSVVQAFKDGARNTKDACAMAGVDRSLYYRAMKNPYVQSQRAQQITATLYIAQEIAERNIPDVLGNIVSIAKGDSREAVPAARFLWDVYGTVRELVGAEDEEISRIGQSFLATFAGKKRYKVTKKGKEVQEEIEIEVPPGTD